MLNGSIRGGKWLFARRYTLDERGNIALIVALGLPVLCGLVGGAVDLGEVLFAQASLQKSTDSAALTGAKQLSSDKSQATADRTKVFADELAHVLAPRWSTTTTAQINVADNSMSVNMTGQRPSLFGTLLPSWSVAVSATATNVTQSALCVLAIKASGSQVVRLQNSAMATASGCLVQSNSDIVVDPGAALQAGAVRTVGGASGPISPNPTTDAPSIPDPFAGLAINVPATCNDNGAKYAGQGTYTLNPGVHCGNLTLSGSTKLVLNAGEHYFVDGQIQVSGNAQLVGSDVVAIFKGSFQTQFQGNATLSLEGRKSGAYSGFVLITDRSYTNDVELSTDSARMLHGTIYLPQGGLKVLGSKNKIADQSPWTVVVAKQITVSGSANLVINSNYSSGVPVPAGVGSGILQLIR